MRIITSLCPVVLMLVAIAPRSAAAQPDLGPEVALLQGGAVGDGVTDAHVTAIDDATLFVAYRLWAPDAGTAACRARFVDRAGAMLGAELTIATDCEGLVTALAGSALVIAWKGGTAIRWRRVDIATRAWIETSAREFASPGSVSSLACHDTMCLLVFRQTGPSDEPDVWALRLGADGTAIDPSPLAIATSAEAEFDACVATDGTDFLIAYSHYTSLSFTRRPQPVAVLAQRVRSNGTVDEAVTLAPGTTLNLVPTARASIGYGAGAYFVAWNGGGFRGARVSSAGAVLTPSTSLEPGGSAYRPGETYATLTAIGVADGIVEMLLRVQRNANRSTYYDVYAASYDPATFAARTAPTLLDDRGRSTRMHLVAAVRGVDAVWLAQATEGETAIDDSPTVVARAVGDGAAAGGFRPLVQRGASLRSAWLVADASTTWAGAIAPSGTIATRRSQRLAAIASGPGPIAIGEPCTWCSVAVHRRGDVIDVVSTRIGDAVVQSVGRAGTVGAERAFVPATVSASSDHGVIGARVTGSEAESRIEAGVVGEDGLTAVQVLATVPSTTRVDELDVAWAADHAIVRWREGVETIYGSDTIFVYTARIRAVAPDGVPLGAAATTVPFTQPYQLASASGDDAALLVAYDGTVLHGVRVDSLGVVLDTTPVRFTEAVPVLYQLQVMPLRASDASARWVALWMDSAGMVRACELHATLSARCGDLSEIPSMAQLVTSREPLDQGWIGYVRADPAGDVLALRTVRSTTTIEPLDGGIALDASMMPDAGSSLDASMMADTGTTPLDAGMLHDANLLLDGDRSGHADASSLPTEGGEGCSCRAGVPTGTRARALVLGVLVLAALATRRSRGAST